MNDDADIPWTGDFNGNMLPVFTNYPWLPDVVANPFKFEKTYDDHF